MVVVIGAGELHRAAEWASLAPALRTPPWGFAWAAPLLPATPHTAELLRWATIAAASFAGVGLFTRAALCVTAALLLLALALPQQWGAGVHTHHLWWFTVLLAASPCADALSLDAKRRGATAPPAPSLAHGVPVRAAWLCIGLILFFPGFWKLRTQGLDWALTDNLKHQLWFKWLEHGAQPAVRLDRWPALLKVGGAGVLALELGFVGIVLVERLRPFAVAAALAFHAATRAFFFIGFSSLWACYVVFAPWSRWLDREPTSPAPPRSPWPALAAATFVLCGVALAGARGVEHGWPFACYPTFRHDPGPEAPVLVAVEVLEGGETREVPLDFLRGDGGQKEWSAMWHLLSSPTAQGLTAWWRAHRTATGAVKRVQLYRAWWPADPDARTPPRRGELLLEVSP
ncbi:MAG: hypothetical protein JNK82_11525 [Myxococcaceae bacterium]|nr:hypothetical protein [Myxococcaceae bacterium]